MALESKTTTSEFPWIGRLGRLRPWETRELAEHVSHSDDAAPLSRRIADFISSEFASVASSEDLEELILVAADVRAIFRFDVRLFEQSVGRGSGWLLFQKALGGASFIELEQDRLRERAKGNIVDNAVNVVTSYVKRNSVPPEGLADLISDVHAALETAARKRATGHPTPAVPIDKSVHPDYIISLEDGKKFKSLKRYLRTELKMTPDEYRAKWGLPPDYPMVAPSYAKARSELVKELAKKRGRRQRAKGAPKGHSTAALRRA
jgi:predicted transcriptional regulator